MENTGEVDIYAKEAHLLIDNVIDNSEKNIKTLIDDEKSVDDVLNIKWFTIEEFTIDHAKQKIEEFIQVKNTVLTTLPGLNFAWIKFRGFRGF